jgi:hypothetical protein
LDIKLPISLCDELSDDVIDSRALLNLASGEIEAVEYEDYDLEKNGPPSARRDYEFTSGTLTHQGKDVEFSVEVDRYTGKYSVNANELLEIKMRAAALFSGLGGMGAMGGGGADIGGKPAAAKRAAAAKKSAPRKRAG